MKILYLSLKSDLQGPFPKIDPLLIRELTKLGCQITKLSWGRHSEKETLCQKVSGRFDDLIHALLALIKDRFDILYVVTTLDEHSLVRDVPLLLATCWFPVKKVLIIHGSKTSSLIGRGHILYKFFTHLLVRLSDSILLLSSEELENLKKFESKGKYYRINNPFLPNRDIEVGELTNTFHAVSYPILLFVGRLIEAKGILDLLEAMPIILRQVDCHLLIAGDGEEKEEIIRFIKKENLESRVSLLGYMDSDHLADLYKTASVFILPTYFGEGFPTVIAEAMSFGLPIITTPIRGARDHLKENLNALFVQPRNPCAIADSVVRLLTEPDLCLKMRCANLDKIQEFRPERVVPRYYEVFGEVLNREIVEK